ncbi:tyrosine recombinase XerS [Lactococcus garvieae]|uniref:tyrosine recombinase XerS n=1 Tax=Lactococcus garvieae TaxID=1363 RepID=UPI00385389C4
MKRELLLANIDRIKKRMPDFVLEYYQSKLSIPYSLTTLYQYLLEYERFFNWLIDSDVSKAKNIADIDLDTLENLARSDIEGYILYLREKPRQNNKSGLTQNSVKRTLAALSSLFKYLTEQAEGINGEPYFYRNVMKKVQIQKNRETLASRAENIKGKLFLGDETQGFLDFIDNEYEKSLSNRALSSFNKNKERDLAIIALMLASGVRLSEAVNINISDLNMKTLVVEVTRKGGKRDAVNIAKFAELYLLNYLEIREQRYKPEKNNKAFFLSIYRGQASRIDGSSIEKLVSKYSQAFKVRITPHKLRHTLATRLYAQTNSQVLVSHQLGHSSTQVTDLYTHIISQEQKNALDEL